MCIGPLRRPRTSEHQLHSEGPLHQDLADSETRCSAALQGSRTAVCNKSKNGFEAWPCRAEDIYIHLIYLIYHIIYYNILFLFITQFIGSDAQRPTLLVGSDGRSPRHHIGLSQPSGIASREADVERNRSESPRSSSVKHHRTPWALKSLLTAT